MTTHLGYETAASLVGNVRKGKIYVLAQNTWTHETFGPEYINLSGISLLWVLFRRMDAWEHLQSHLLLSECSSHPSPWINCFTLLTHNPKKQDAIKVFKWSNHGQIIRGDQWNIVIFSILQLFQWHHNVTLWQVKWIPCIKNTTTSHWRASFTFWLYSATTWDAF